VTQTLQTHILQNPLPQQNENNQNDTTKKQQHGRHAYDLGKKSSTARLREGKLFTDTTGFMIAIQDLVPSTNNYKKYIFNDPNIINNICKKCQEKSETIHHQHVTGQPIVTIK
jgi:hypothetical protein